MTKKRKGKSGTGPSGRNLKVRVKTARGRRLSSTRWLQRQLNDPYVQAAVKDGYRSRAAYKLSELDDRFDFLHPGLVVVDLGAAPGGWSQVAVERLKGRGQVIAIDINPFESLPGVEILEGDIREPGAEAAIRAAMTAPADVVLNDMAPPSSGHSGTDHLRIMGLVEAAADLAEHLLSPGGIFIAKVWQGGTEANLLAHLKRVFRKVRHVKPKASRASSAEIYLVATDFRGQESLDGERSAG